MKHKLTGASTPFGGVSWSSEISAKERFQYLLLYLESKRILTNPIEMEILDQCTHSVLDIKGTLVEVTKDVVFNEEDTVVVRSLVDACNTYLDETNGLNVGHIIYKRNGKWENLSFDSAMKKFRNAFRKNIAVIEKKHKLTFTKEIPKEW